MWSSIISKFSEKIKMGTDIIAMAPVDKDDVYSCLSSSIQYGVALNGFKNDKTVQHIRHFIN